PRTEQVPFTDGRLHLGTYQRIFLVAFEDQCADEWMVTRVGESWAFDLPSLRGPHFQRGMERARRHQRALARVALIFLALIAELIGRSLSHRLDFGQHVRTASYSGADYYPFLLAAVKVGVALMLARLAWRFVKETRVVHTHGESDTPKGSIGLCT